MTPELEAAFRAAFGPVLFDRLTEALGLPDPDAVYHDFCEGKRIPRFTGALDAAARLAQDGIVVEGTLRRLTHDELAQLRQAIFSN